MVRQGKGDLMATFKDLGLTVDDLRGRQSVRATFKLPPQVIELLSLAAAQLGLKQKSLFDQLVEDRQILEKLAADAEKYSPGKDERRQKTYVLSRNSLTSLDYVARAYKLPRDVLVEISIQRLRPVLKAEQERNRRRTRVMAELQQHLAQGRELIRQSQRLLGEDDPVLQRLYRYVSGCETCCTEMQDMIDQGKCMEDK